MYVISDYYKASRDVIAFVAGYYEKLFSAELLDQMISIQMALIGRATRFSVIN